MAYDASNDRLKRLQIEALAVPHYTYVVWWRRALCLCNVAIGGGSCFCASMLYGTLCTASCSSMSTPCTPPSSYTTMSKHGRPCFPRRPSPRENLLGLLWRDIIDLNRYAVFSFDTIKVILGTFPFYGGARLIDEKVQKAFHADCCHRDRNQAPEWCRDLSKYGLGIPIATLGLMTLFGGTQEFRTTGRVFLVGMPFVIFGKDIIKKI